MHLRAFPVFPLFPVSLPHLHEAEILVAIAAAAQAEVVAAEFAGELRVGQFEGRFQPLAAVGLLHDAGALEVVAGRVVLQFPGVGPVS